MGKQESMGDWFQMAKDYAKAEKELKIEQWVEVTIYYGYAEKQVSLYHYNLPREMYLRYQWVIRWRMAKLQCQYPKQIVSTSLYFMISVLENLWRLAVVCLNLFLQKPR